MLRAIARRLAERYWSRAFQAGGVGTWMQEPLARAAINRRVTGDPDQWPMEWFQARYATRPFEAGLSLGCGEGALERDVLAKGICGTLLGLDLSAAALDLARQRAAELGLQVEYQRADLNQASLPEASFDLILAHQALHHVENLEGCLAQTARALRPGGIFYLDEYVGPSRQEWNRQLLAAAEDVYQRLPRAVRRRRRLQLPVDWRDPSEAVRSSEIIPVVERHFAVRERHDYGGNLLAVIYPHLRLEAVAPEQRASLLQQLISGEENLLAEGELSYYTVAVAQLRDG